MFVDNVENMRGCGISLSFVVRMSIFDSEFCFFFEVYFVNFVYGYCIRENRVFLISVFFERGFESLDYDIEEIEKELK